MAQLDLSNRTDLPATFDERTTLTQFLRYVRLTVHAKCLDLAQSDAIKTLLVKGLEYTHTIVLDANILDANNLYVAMTRGSTSLTVLSDRSRLTPRPTR